MLEVLPWIWEPTHSHSSGVPSHSTRLPTNMIATASSAPAPIRKSSLIASQIARPTARL